MSFGAKFIVFVIAILAIIFLNIIGQGDNIVAYLAIVFILGIPVAIAENNKNVAFRKTATHEINKACERNQITISKKIDLFLCINDEIYDYKMPTSLIVDDKKKLFGFVTYNGGSGTTTEHFYKYSDLINFNLFEDGEQSLQGRGLIAAGGALLFGITGAIVGTVAGNRKVLNTCSDLSVKINVNNLQEPILEINIVSNCKKTMQGYISGKNLADEIIGVLTYIQNNAQNT